MKYIKRVTGGKTDWVRIVPDNVTFSDDSIVEITAEEYASTPRDDDMDSTPTIR